MTDPATMTKVNNVRDVTLNLEAGEADITTRGNSGWRANAPPLRECTVEFQMVWRPVRGNGPARGMVCLAVGRQGLMGQLPSASVILWKAKYRSVNASTHVAAVCRPKADTRDSIGQ